MRLLRSLTRWVTGAVMLAGALGLTAFLLFAAYVTRPLDPETVVADAIVVLTGGGGRIQTGATLLAEGRGQRLLISGVNRQTTSGDIVRLTGLPAAKFACCVDLGYSARNTVGNAEETAQWARASGYRSLIVVTAAYHMPRSMAELYRRMPDIELYPYPITPLQFSDTVWWLDPVKFRALGSEFVKLVPAAGRLIVSRLFGAQSEAPERSPEPGDGSITVGRS
ncbi:MAG: YdcF family protein [Hyphomicrobiaceae bacterium]